MNKQISEGMKRRWKVRKENSPDSLWQELVASQKSHIEDLQREVKRLENFVQVLSDDKYFKPQILEHPLPPTKTETVYGDSDFVFQTPTDTAPLGEDLDISAELADLQKSYDENRTRK